MKNIVIVGAGSAGISVAARLTQLNHKLDIKIIDPSEVHYYQPLWTLVGAGEAPKEVTKKYTKDLIPSGVQWLKDSVTRFEPDNNKVITANNQEGLNYDYLIVCPGIQVNWDKIEGLKEAIGKSGVCSNYSYDYVNSTWESIQNHKEGPALFTMPNTPIKCGGGPQKIMYLAEDYFRKNGCRDKVSVEFCTATGKMFGVDKYNSALEKRGVTPHFGVNLEKIDGEQKKAYFRHLESGELIEKSYGMIHVVPPMSAPDFIKDSPLANSEGLGGCG